MKKIIFLLWISTVWSANSLAETSKDLLAQAIQISNSPKSNLTVEQRLQKYEAVQDIIEKIISEHPGTDEGIKLISGQSVGNFDYSAVQNNYVKELTEYFDTVCKVSPSFKCIAFVSLNQGVESCKVASSFNQLDSAHKEIMNSLTIFTSQGAKPQYQNLALNAYRGCLSSSKVKTSSSIQDYFSSQLVPSFISLGKTDQAKAVIQNMSDPYLKFASVIELAKSSDNGITRDYVKRMMQFINEKMGGRSTLDKQSQNLAVFRLKTEMLRQNNYPLTNNDLTSDMDGKLGWIFRSNDVDKNICSAQYNKRYFDEVVELLDASMARLEELSGGRPGYTVNRILHGMRMDQIAGFLDLCANLIDGNDLIDFNNFNGKSYGLTLEFYARIRAFNAREGEKFLTHAALVGYQADEIREYAFVFEGQNPLYAEFERSMDLRSKVFNQYYKFKRTVRDGDMCSAVETLFKEFKGGKDYSRAIAYLIDSPDVDRTKKYDCGDAELEMLLN